MLFGATGLSSCPSSSWPSSAVVVVVVVVVVCFRFVGCWLLAVLSPFCLLSLLDSNTTKQNLALGRRLG